MILLGVRIEFARSWLAALAIVSACYAAAAYGLMPELPVAAALLLGVFVSAMLSLSLLVHELAHARVAMGAGVPIDYIRLFGGGALCKRAAPIDVPRDQFMVAAAGPLASVGLGVLFMAPAVVLEILGAPSALTLTLGFVTLANVLIALSNLVPVFPFDGAKVLHAVVWRRARDRQVASERLRRGGREFARVVLTLGLLSMAWAGDVLLGIAIAGFGLYLLRLPPPP